MLNLSPQFQFTKNATLCQPDWDENKGLQGTDFDAHVREGRKRIDSRLIRLVQFSSPVIEANCPRIRLVDKGMRATIDPE